MALSWQKEELVNTPWEEISFDDVSCSKLTWDQLYESYKKRSDEINKYKHLQILLTYARELLQQQEQKKETTLSPKEEKEKGELSVPGPDKK